MTSYTPPPSHPRIQHHERSDPCQDIFCGFRQIFSRHCFPDKFPKRVGFSACASWSLFLVCADPEKSSKETAQRDQLKHGAGGTIRPGSWSRGKIDKTKKLLPLLVDIYKDCIDNKTKKSTTCQTVLPQGNQQRVWRHWRSQEGRESQSFSWQPKSWGLESCWRIFWMFVILIWVWFKVMQDNHNVNLGALYSEVSELELSILNHQHEHRLQSQIWKGEELENLFHFLRPCNRSCLGTSTLPLGLGVWLLTRQRGGDNKEPRK